MRVTGLRGVTAILAVFLTSSLSVGRAAQGDVVTADPASFVGEYCSLSVCPASQLPAVAYYDVINKDLKYVSATVVDGTDWGEAVTVAWTGDVGRMASLVHLSSSMDNVPAVAYVDESASAVKFIKADTMEEGAGDNTTTTTTTTTSSITWNQDSAVVLQTFPVGSAVTALSSAASPSAVCVAFTVNDGSNAVMFTTAAMPGGASAATALSWSTPTAAVSALTASHVSVTYIDGAPAMALYDATNRDLLYVAATASDGSSWAAPVTVASLGDSGSHCSLAEVAGHPAILHRAMIKATYVRATDVAGTAWDTPVLLDGATSNSGTRASLAVVDGRPFAAWLNVGTNTLRSAEAVTANGSAWESPVVLAFARSGAFVSTADVDGFPGVTFYDDTARTLKFTLAEFPSPSPSPTPSATPSSSPSSSPSPTSSVSPTASTTASITITPSVTPSKGSAPSPVAGIQAPPPESGGGGGPDPAPIIGGTVGGVALLAVVVVAVVLVMRRQKQTNNSNKNNNGDSSGSGTTAAEELYPTNIKAVKSIPKRHTVIQGNPAFGTKKPGGGGGAGGGAGGAGGAGANSDEKVTPSQPNHLHDDGIELSATSPRSAIAKAGASQTSALKASYGVPQAHHHMRRSPRASPAATTASRGRTPAGNRFPVHEEDDDEDAEFEGRDTRQLDSMFGVRPQDVDVGFTTVGSVQSPQSPEWM